MSANVKAAFKQATLALGLVSCITAALAAATPPGTVAAERRIVTVDRTNKSDRIPAVSAATMSADRQSGSPVSLLSPRYLPLGCDPAFSRVANPERASVFGRCTA